MRTGPRPSSMRARVALATALSLCAAPLEPLFAQAQAPATAKPATAQPATAKPASAQPATVKPAAAASPNSAVVVDPDGGWPKNLTTAAGAALVVYQPQVASWERQRRAVLFSAVSYAPRGATQPFMGTIKLESNTSVAVDERLVNIEQFQITESNFPKLSKDQVLDAIEQISGAMKQGAQVITLDRVLAYVDKSQIIPKNVEGVKSDPPRVFFSKTPAVLVNIDGDPIWTQIQANDLKYAINTNWDLFQHGPTGTLYLRNNDAWLKASAIDGPWTYAGTLPDSFSKLPADQNWTEVRRALPGKKLSSSAVPTVFVSTIPAELILLKGEPSYLTVTTGSPLLWVMNTESDLFRMSRTGTVYYLVAGRWFSAPDFTGPWTFATTNMPEDFKKIPLEHERSRVLASVPGTQQAAEAVLLAQIPQTARVSKTLKAPDVVYDGAPQFEPVPQTTVARAVNTDKDIIKVGDLYYMCFQGVWFMGRSPQGPWEVTGSVPGQIYEIPVSSPAHSVTYVTVEDDDDDAIVFATALAFTGVMVAWGCAVWGTGYYYPPYYRGGFYYPHYPTYGYGARYNPWTGSYGRGAVAYGPYGGAGVGARYNPRTGTYSRGAAAWGPGGAVGAAGAYNPRTGAVGATRQGSNVYGSWGSTAVQRGDQWASTQRVTNNRTGTTTRTTQTSNGGAAVTRTGPGADSGAVRTGSGDVYAGRDGNVYKRNDGGGWSQSDGGGGWNNVQQPTQQQRDAARDQASTRAGQVGGAAATSATDRSGGADRTATTGQLDRDASARSSGAQRTRDASTQRSTGGSTSSTSRGSGSYRPSGGGARAGGGGGGRRR